jgi:hypothetical protein
MASPVTSTNTPPVLNMEWYQSQTVRFQFLIADGDGNALDLSTGYTAEMDVRETAASSVTLVEASSSGGEITLLDGSGDYNLQVEIAASEWANWTAWENLSWEKAVYDLKLANGTEIDFLVRGSITVYQSVTR